MTTRTDATSPRASKKNSPELASDDQPQADKVRLSVNINAATEEALQTIVEREGVTMTEAVRRLIGYGMVFYKAEKIDEADVLIRRGGQTERIVIL